MLLIEHDMDLVMGLCESITVLDFGKRIAAGPPDTVQRHPAVVAAYLGVASAQSGDEADRVPDRGVDSSVSSNVHVPSSTSSNWRPLTETAPSHTHHQAWNRTTHRAGPGRPEPLLEVHGLRVVYGQVPAVHNLSLRVEEGQAVAILGANGAGKSSTLRTIGGLQRPQAGRILFEGTRIDHRSTPELVDRGICLVPDTKDLFPRFTVEENLRMGVGRRASRDYPVLRDGVLELFPLLRRRLNAPAWQLSGGERQMLALGRALVAQPRLLLLDEPSLGLAPLAVEAIFQALATIVARGTAVLLVEQSTAAALRLADFAYVLRTGHLALAGPSANLLHDPHVVDLYLGGEVHGSPVS
jgi:branched-chain amino acid transport system ATP-binding protein